MIIVQNLTKTFKSDGNTVTAVDDVSFQVRKGEFYVLLGPSGSGKTTTLRALAALEQPTGGEILLDGKTVYSSRKQIWVPPEERPVGMVFQSYALWPHMTVYENIAFPLRYGRRGIPKRLISERVEKVLCALQIEELRHRPITALSGGQQQRVALARALALEPQVLLMDEPLSNLDAKLRSQLRLELKQLTRKLAMTTVHVTHDQTEAMVMGDVIAVMHQGKLLQVGSPEEVYLHPRHLFVAQFLGETNFFQGTLREMQEFVGIVTTDMGEFRVHFSAKEGTGRSVTVGIRTEDIRLAQPSSENVVVGRVIDRIFLGDIFVYTIEIPPGCTIQAKFPAEVQVPAHGQVRLEFPPEKCIGFWNRSPAAPGQGL